MALFHAGCGASALSGLFSRHRYSVTLLMVSGPCFGFGRSSARACCKPTGSHRLRSSSPSLRQLVSIRARIPFLKELRKIRWATQEAHSISVSAALPLDSDSSSYCRTCYCQPHRRALYGHQLVQVPAFHPFTLAVELWQEPSGYHCLISKFFSAHSFSSRTSADGHPHRRAPMPDRCSLQIFRRDSNIVSDTVHLAEMRSCMYSASTLFATSVAPGTAAAFRRRCDQLRARSASRSARRRQRGAVRREAAVHYRITRCASPMEICTSLVKRCLWPVSFYR